MPPIEAADVLCSLDNEDSCMDTYQQVSPLSASLTVHACRSQSGLWPGVLSSAFLCQSALVCSVNCCTLESSYAAKPVLSVMGSEKNILAGFHSFHNPKGLPVHLKQLRTRQAG